MILVRSTRGCANSPRILFALEELGLPYEIEVADDGTFTRDWGSPGPTLTDGDITTIEPGAILRHLARRSGRLWPASLAEQAAGDRWIDFLQRRLARSLDGDPARRDPLLAFVDRQVAPGPWFFGAELTILDCFYAYLAQPYARQRVPWAQFPALAAYVDRIAARPAFVRSTARVPT